MILIQLAVVSWLPTRRLALVRRQRCAWFKCMLVCLFVCFLCVCVVKRHIFWRACVNACMHAGVCVIEREGEIVCV